MVPPVLHTARVCEPKVIALAEADPEPGSVERNFSKFHQAILARRRYVPRIDGSRIGRPAAR